MTQDPPIPGWRKAFYPLSFGKVMLIFFIAQIVAAIPIVTLREAFKIPVPEWLIGGLGGFLGVIGVRWLAARQLAEQAAKSPPTE